MTYYLQRGCFMIPKGIPNKRYPPAFKKFAAETMPKEHFSCKPGSWRTRDTGAKAQVVQALGRDFPRKPLLEIAQLPRATFYYHRKPSNIRITTTTDESRQTKRTCRLRYADSKPFLQLEQYLLKNIVYLFGVTPKLLWVFLNLLGYAL